VGSETGGCRASTKTPPSIHNPCVEVVGGYTGWLDLDASFAVDPTALQKALAGAFCEIP
jgi:hypothetical protein